MRWEESDETESFAGYCEACDAPILVTVDNRTEERFIYYVVCPACNEAQFIVSIPEELVR